MDYPDDKDVLETFECFQPTSNSFVHRLSFRTKALADLTSLTRSYKFSHMHLTTKALIASTKVVSPSLAAARTLADFWSDSPFARPRTACSASNS